MTTKVAVITCYKDPDYVRAQTLRAGLKACSDVELIVVKNQVRNLLRYFEILYKLIRLKFKQKPDVYLLTFRGQEILWLVLLLAGKKPVIFDEFIIPIAYAADEPHARSFSNGFKHLLSRLSEPFYGFLLRRCALILSDTQAHAELSARASQVNLRQYVVIPVGADEEIFKISGRSKSSKNEGLKVFFYGNMLPLHGLGVILEAAEQLNKQPEIKFKIIGGNRKVVAMVDAAKAKGSHIEYQKWVELADLPAEIRSADLCLGGPFGNTPQAQHVITGKTFQFLACGAPTVVGRSEVSQEFFKDKSNALLVTQDNPEALAAAIVWASNNQAKLTKIGKAGRELYDQKFSRHIIAGKLQSALDEILNG